jgi:hypothetical protein
MMILSAASPGSWHYRTFLRTQQAGD